MCLLLGEGRVGFGHFSFLLISLVKEEEMAQKRGFTLLEFIGTIRRVFVESLGAEWIGSEEAIGADMPGCGEAETGRMIQHGDADVLAADDAMVVAPCGAFAYAEDLAG